MASNPAFRISKKTVELNQRLANLRASPASRPLPPNIASLSLRYQGIKGNATLGHWVKKDLPALRWANPSLKVTIEDPIKPGSEPANFQTPGITINLTDSPEPIFYPFPSSIKSHNITPEFLATLSKPDALEALRRKNSENNVAPRSAAESA